MVGFAVGKTKKIAKLNASRHILQAMVPELYEEWQRAQAPGSLNL